MDNNLIDLAKLIFTEHPKNPYSIQMDLDEYNSLDDLFEVLLHLFVYGFKLRKLSINNISLLKEYFKAIGVNFEVETIPYSEYEFLTNPKYLNRYCSIPHSTFDNFDLNNINFYLSRNYKTSDKIDNMYAVYVHEIPNNFNESFIAFLSFNFKLY